MFIFWPPSICLQKCNFCICHLFAFNSFTFFETLNFQSWCFLTFVYWWLLDIVDCLIDNLVFIKSCASAAALLTFDWRVTRRKDNGTHTWRRYILSYQTDQVICRASSQRPGFQLSTWDFFYLLFAAQPWLHRSVKSCKDLYFTTISPLWLLRYFTTTSLLFQELKPIPALPLALQRGQGRIVGGEVANDGEFPFQVTTSIWGKPTDKKCNEATMCARGDTGKGCGFPSLTQISDNSIWFF